MTGIVDIVEVSAIVAPVYSARWEKLKPMLKGYRMVSKVPRAFDGFDYLIAELIRRERRSKKAAVH